MGGHGGLNILPQKRWNVYNFDNREKVRQDEEAAAKEEQLKREDSRKRDAEFRLERLRTARGLAPLIPEPQAADPAPSEAAEPTPTLSEDNGNHINLFEGIRIFDLAAEAPERSERREKSEERSKKRAKKEEVRVVTAEDEKYRLGYGLAGKGVKVPWYLEKKGRKGEGEEKENGEERFRDEDNVEKKRKKSLEELREERLKREEREKKRERDLLRGKGGLPKDGERLKRRDDGSGSRWYHLGVEGSYFQWRA